MNSLKNKLITIAAVMAVVLVGGAGYVLATGTTLVPRTAQAAPALFSQDAVTAIFDAASPAVVEIQVSQRGGRTIQGGLGSGFLVDTNGNILTNNHVVEGATRVRIVFDDGRSAAATVVGTDRMNDLAVVRVDPANVSGITPLRFADSSLVRRGQMAIAIGAPYGLPSTITVGVVSGLNRSLPSSTLIGMLQTDAAINPGNSGGPLLDANGLVVGVNTAIESAPTARGIGFAVPSNVAKKQLPDLVAGKTITRPWLGISGLALSADAAKTLNLSVDKGVYVIAVTPDSPAAKAGLKGGGTEATGTPGKGGDVITAVDGNAVSSVLDLSGYLIANKKTGDAVSLTVLRGGSRITVSATLGAWPEEAPRVLPLPGIPDVPNIPWPWPFGGERPTVPAQ